MNEKEARIQKCLEWLSLQTPIKTINKRHDSSIYKHMVEKYYGNGFYLPREDFIEAAKISKILFKQAKGSLWLAISEKTLKKIKGYY